MDQIKGEMYAGFNGLNKKKEWLSYTNTGLKNSVKDQLMSKEIS